MSQLHLSGVFLLLLLSIISTRAGSVQYVDCGSTANVTDLRVSKCTTPPCVFLKGGSYEIEIDAVSASSSNTLPYKVTAKVEFIPITIMKGDACSVLRKGSCPVKSGDDFTYINDITVSPSFPSFHTKVTALVQDDRKGKVICAVLDVIIKKASKKNKSIRKRLHNFYNSAPSPPSSSLISYTYR